MATKKSTSAAAKTAAPAKVAAKKTAAKAPTTADVKKSAAAEPETAASTPAHTPEAAKKHTPTHDEIAALAHKYHVERGHHHGSHNDDWLRAERELSGK